MSNKVVIDTHGPTITIESSTASFEEVLAAALNAFDHALKFFPGHKSETAGSAMGFADRRATPPVQPSSMRWLPGAYPIQDGEAQ